jgi:hypothetical protein
MESVQRYRKLSTLRLLNIFSTQSLGRQPRSPAGYSTLLPSRGADMMLFNFISSRYVPCYSTVIICEIEGIQFSMDRDQEAHVHSCSTTRQQIIGWSFSDVLDK